LKVIIYPARPHLRVAPSGSQVKLIKGAGKEMGKLGIFLFPLIKKIEGKKKRGIVPDVNINIYNFLKCYSSVLNILG
jgi:hypothetical protein